MRMAVSMAHALDVVLIERVPSAAVRASAPTWSTPGRPCRNARKAASDAVTSVNGGSGAAAGRLGSDSAVGSRTCVMPSIFPCRGSGSDARCSDGWPPAGSGDEETVLLEDPHRAGRDQVGQEPADVALAVLGSFRWSGRDVAEAVQHRGRLVAADLRLAGAVARRTGRDGAADVARTRGR